MAIITLDSPADDITPVVLTTLCDGLYVGESAIVIGRGETVGGNGRDKFFYIVIVFPVIISINILNSSRLNVSKKLLFFKKTFSQFY